jgi:hypothetical protein
MNPTPEEKCDMEEIKRLLSFAVKYINELEEIIFKPDSPSPEARVDWDKVVDEEFGAVMHHEIGEEAWRIAKVCKAAFEKGREAR